jgi:glycosyltransferase involved in cell wall biosynthesis
MGAFFISVMEKSQNMSRIAMLLPDLEAGGAQRVMLLLARKFVERGHHVDLILLSSSGPLHSHIPGGVKVVELAARSFCLGQIGFFLSSICCLARWMRRKTPDVLLSTITGANLVALLARRCAAVPARIVIREATRLKNVNSALRLQAINWLYPQADTVIALSSVMATDLIEKVGVPSSSIRCIANPVDTVFINKQGREPVSHCWLDSEQIKVIVSVGRLVLPKDYETLLRSFALLPRKLSARLIILGEGAEHVTLERLALHLGIADVIQFVGYDANPWRWMARADLFVLSSRWEGHPNALLEALALDLPIVATEYDDSVNVLSARYGFTVVPAGNSTLLAQAIEDQLGSGLSRSYEFANEVQDVVCAYLSVLGCDESPLGGAAFNHETASTAK